MRRNATFTLAAICTCSHLQAKSVQRITLQQKGQISYCRILTCFPWSGFALLGLTGVRCSEHRRPRHNAYRYLTPCPRQIISFRVMPLLRCTFASDSNAQCRTAGALAHAHLFLTSLRGHRGGTLRSVRTTGRTPGARPARSGGEFDELPWAASATIKVLGWAKFAALYGAALARLLDEQLEKWRGI